MITFLHRSLNSIRKSLVKGNAKKDLRIIADKDRIVRHKQEWVYFNGESCEFHFISPEEIYIPADLIIFAVKYNGLENAIQSVRNRGSPNSACTYIFLHSS